jgi:tetratricopeptide (TPR) repeat protein
MGQFKAAAQLVPEHADNLCDIAHCHLEVAGRYMMREDVRAAKREMDHAINYYDRALKSAPASERALHGKNEALEMRGLYDEALETARWASEVVGPSVTQQLFLARELAERGDADQALLAYRQAVAMGPKSPTAHWAIGQFYLSIQRPDDAVPHLQEAYRLDPKRRYIATELRRIGAEIPEIFPEHYTG